MARPRQRVYLPGLSPTAEQETALQRMMANAIPPREPDPEMEEVDDSIIDITPAKEKPMTDNSNDDLLNQILGSSTPTPSGSDLNLGIEETIVMVAPETIPVAVPADTSTVVTVPPVEVVAEKPKRKRRTKAEMEAAKAVAAPIPAPVPTTVIDTAPAMVPTSSVKSSPAITITPAPGHAILPPSASHFWMNCAGQPLLASRCPKTTNPNAEWGTECHHLSETRIQAYIDKKPFDYSGILDVEQRELVRGYVEFVIEKVIKPFTSGATMSVVLVEQKLEIIKDLVWGKADTLLTRSYIENGEKRVDGIIVDLKTGFHDVKVPGNSQFAIYALGLRRQFGINGKITVIGYLPRVSTREIPWEKWTLTQDMLDAWEKSVTEKAEAARLILIGQQQPTFTAGEHCTFCPAIGVCPSYTKQLEQDADVLLSAKPLHDAPPEFPDPTMLTPEQRGKILAVAPRLKKYLESVEVLAYADATRGIKIPGFKLVDAASKRGWNKEIGVATIGETLKTLGVTEPYELKLIGITEVEKQIGTGKIGHLTTKGEGKQVLVPEDDKRPASTNVLSDRSSTLLTDLT